MSVRQDLNESVFGNHCYIKSKVGNFMSWKHDDNNHDVALLDLFYNVTNVELVQKCLHDIKIFPPTHIMQTVQIMHAALDERKFSQQEIELLEILCKLKIHTIEDYLNCHQSEGYEKLIKKKYPYAKSDPFEKYDIVLLHDGLNVPIDIITRIKVKGNCIIRFNKAMFTKQDAFILQILSAKFKTLHIVKPCTSNPSEHTKYIILEDFELHGKTPLPYIVDNFRKYIYRVNTEMIYMEMMSLKKLHKVLVYGVVNTNHCTNPMYNQLDVTLDNLILHTRLTSSPTYCPSSPTYCPSSPTYCPSSPTYCPSSPTYCPSSPTYCPSSPTYCPSSPTYRPSSPTYCPA
jgi:hypothetical protein